MVNQLTPIKRRALNQRLASKVGAVVFQDVFQAIGGTEGFAEWARNHRTDFYKLYAQYMKPASGLTDEGGEGKRLIIELHFPAAPPPAARTVEVNSHPPLERRPLSYQERTHSDLPPGVAFVGDGHG